MNLMQLFLAVPAAFLILGNSVAIAGETVDIAGAIACVNDKWTESEPDKGHKLADLVQRCVLIPNDPAAPNSSALLSLGYRAGRSRRDHGHEQRPAS